MSTMLQLGRGLVVAGLAFAASAGPAQAYWTGGGPYYGGGYRDGYRPVFMPRPYYAPPPVYYAPYWRLPVVYVPQAVPPPPVTPRRRVVARPVHVAERLSPFAGAGREGALGAPLPSAPPVAAVVSPPEAPFFNN